MKLEKRRKCGYHILIRLSIRTGQKQASNDVDPSQHKHKVDGCLGMPTNIYITQAENKWFLLQT